jgi:hypothetical protein
MIKTAVNGLTNGLGRLHASYRELNTLLVSCCLGVAIYAGARWWFPVGKAENVGNFLDKYVGFSWPFFAVVALILLYVAGAWIVDVFALGTTRQWHGIDQILQWATEACPLVGLLTTFLSLLFALLAYGEAGPGDPKTQAAFITQFAIAFGSSITGGVLALVAFTLHKLLPEDEVT